MSKHNRERRRAGVLRHQAELKRRQVVPPPPTKEDEGDDDNWNLPRLLVALPPAQRLGWEALCRFYTEDFALREIAFSIAENDFAGAIEDLPTDNLLTLLGQVEDASQLDDINAVLTSRVIDE